MARLSKAINYSDIPMDEYRPLPEGDYNVVAQSTSIEQTKAGNGQMIKAKLQVTGPTHAGAILFMRLNIVNPNPQAEEIGRRQLGHLMKAINLDRLEDTDDILGKPFAVHVEIEPASGQYKESNNITKIFEAIGGVATTPTRQSAPQSAPASSAPQKPSARPW